LTKKIGYNFVIIFASLTSVFVAIIHSFHARSDRRRNLPVATENVQLVTRNFQLVWASGPKCHKNSAGATQMPQFGRPCF
jgi:sensor domain CHASE-containing protein